MVGKALKTINEEFSRIREERLVFKVKCRLGTIKFNSPYKVLSEKAEVLMV
ncbi:hypothetical protein DRO35_05835, partial [Candidatus Bathyarchaeota archaeon]